jgi:hypothetical protein
VHMFVLENLAGVLLIEAKPPVGPPVACAAVLWAPIGGGQVGVKKKCLALSLWLETHTSVIAGGFGHFF